MVIEFGNTKTGPGKWLSLDELKGGVTTMQRDFILLDRTGSMAEQGKWQEALKGINDYVTKLAIDKIDTGVTLAAFDRTGSFNFDVVRDRIVPSTWAPVKDGEIVNSHPLTPRGWTPLYDAFARIVALAKEGSYDKVAIVVVSDGEENASNNTDLATAKKLIEECRAKGWQVVFIGAEFNIDHTVQSMGANQDMAIATASVNLGGTLRATASNRSAYGRGLADNMNYSSQQRADLEKKLR